MRNPPDNVPQDISQQITGQSHSTAHVSQPRTQEDENLLRAALRDINDATLAACYAGGAPESESLWAHAREVLHQRLAQIQHLLHPLTVEEADEIAAEWERRLMEVLADCPPGKFRLPETTERTLRYRLFAQDELGV